MAKELIISANVHEKKVAILEDGLVTEFYVERRDENQGVVGNLYKGRVMKVLPGMQSAFVDIGLERDAFLYVSDFTEFMEEEEAIDFKEATEERRPLPPRQDDRGRRGDRQQRAAAASPPPVAAPVAEDEVESPELLGDVVEQLAEIMDESVIPPPPSDEEEQGIEAVSEIQPAEVQELQVVEELVQPEEVKETEVTFEKVTDDVAAGETPPVEEAAAEEKTRRGRSRRKGEAADTATSRRGRKKPGAAEEETTKTTTGRATRRRGAKTAAAVEQTRIPETVPLPAPLERITDEDREVEAGELLKDAILQEKIIEKVHEDEYKVQPVHAEPEPEWRVGSFRPQFSAESGFHRVVDEQEAAGPESIAPAESEITEGAATEPEVTPFRHISEALPDALKGFGRAENAGDFEAGSDEAGSTEPAESQAAPAQTEQAEEEEIRQAAQQTDEETPEPVETASGREDVRAEWGAGEGTEDDREAEVRAPSWRAEFA
ncbi:MAG TPA: hypothetical protein VNO70_00025, partial [Blastocatellia bacterium]|nr:hypothetical protein [Blastocatellia bacterium]